MYLNRRPQRQINSAALGAALAITGGMGLALSTLGIIDVVTIIHDEPPTTIYTDPLPPPPEPEPKPIDPKPEAANSAPAPPVAPRPRVTIDHPPVNPVDTTTENPPGPLPPIAGNGAGTGITPRPEIVPRPVLIGASPDPRYAMNFQPDYPSREASIGREGDVTVRVKIGTDGRVKAVERIDATSDAFFEATRRQALSSWRFRPATRDGIPQEEWKRMTVHFILNDG